MSENPMDDRHCTATAKGSGERCKRFASPGSTVCVKHGAGAPQVRAAAERRLEEQRAQSVLRDGLAAAYGDVVPSVDPAEAMLAAVSWKYAEVVALRVKVAELDDKDRVWGVADETIKGSGEFPGTDVTSSARPNVWWQMLHRAEEQLVKFAAAARSAGCDERRVQIAEDLGRQIAGVLQAFAASMLASVVERLDEGPSVFREVWSAAVAVNAPAALRGVGGGVG